jgi:hypothetical protein
MTMDWARFAQMLLNDREYKGQALPKPETLAFIGMRLKHTPSITTWRE